MLIRKVRKPEYYIRCRECRRFVIVDHHTNTAPCCRGTLCDWGVEEAKDEQECPLCRNRERWARDPHYWDDRDADLRLHCLLEEGLA